MALATTVDYMDTHANKYQSIMGQPPPANITLCKSPQEHDTHGCLVWCTALPQQSSSGDQDCCGGP
eukprot:2125044-Karenia_brevis.AAC.1